MSLYTSSNCVVGHLLIYIQTLQSNQHAKLWQVYRRGFPPAFPLLLDFSSFLLLEFLPRDESSVFRFADGALESFGIGLKKPSNRPCCATPRFLISFLTALRIRSSLCTEESSVSCSLILVCCYSLLEILFIHKKRNNSFFIGILPFELVKLINGLGVLLDPHSHSIDTYINFIRILHLSF